MFISANMPLGKRGHLRWLKKKIAISCVTCRLTDNNSVGLAGTGKRTLFASFAFAIDSASLFAYLVLSVLKTVLHWYLIMFRLILRTRTYDVQPTSTCDKRACYLSKYMNQTGIMEKNATQYSSLHESYIPGINDVAKTMQYYLQFIMTLTIY